MLLLRNKLRIDNDIWGYTANTSVIGTLKGMYLDNGFLNKKTFFFKQKYVDSQNINAVLVKN